MIGRREEVDATVAIEIVVDDIVRTYKSRKAETCRRVGERSVEIVAIHGRRTFSHQQQVEIAIMIEIDENRFAPSLHISNSGLGGHILERPVAAVAEQVTASLATDGKEIQPAIVVVINERRERGAVWQRDLCSFSAVSHESTLNSVEMRNGFSSRGGPRRSKKIVGAVTIDVSDCDRGNRCSRRRGR